MAFPRPASDLSNCNSSSTATFFPLCMALFAVAIWPVIRGLRQIQASLRQRCLRLGTISVTVCIWAWVAAGVIFPVVLHLTVQELPMAFHLHFLASQTLCGLIAVSYPQFGVTFIALRGFLPRLRAEHRSYPR